MKGGLWEGGMGYEVDGKRVGVMGFGEMGKKVGRGGGGFNMKVLG